MATLAKTDRLVLEQDKSVSTFVLDTGAEYKRTALIDLDDTLFQCATEIITQLKDQYGVDVDWKHLEFMALTEIVEVQRSGANGQAVIDEIVSEESFFDRCPPMRNAKAFLNNLRAQGFAIHLCTHRGYLPNAEERTKRQLDFHGITYDGLHIIDRSLCKTRFFMDTYGYKPDLVVEDSEREIKSALKHSVAVLRSDRPWNCDVYTRYEIELDWTADILSGGKPVEAEI